jgi:hypothetical protein
MWWKCIYQDFRVSEEAGVVCVHILTMDCFMEACCFFNKKNKTLIALELNSYEAN